MPANLENSAVATGQEKISFHSNPKEGQCQRVFKLLHSCAYFTCQQDYAPHSSSQASIVYELRTSRCISRIQKRQRKMRSTCQHPLDHRKSKGILEKISISVPLTMLKPLTVWITTNWKILKEMRIPDHLTCFLRSLYAELEATVRTRQDWLKIGKGVCQGYIL